jgi:hypothetical protein
LLGVEDGMEDGAVLILGFRDTDGFILSEGMLETLGREDDVDEGWPEGSLLAMVEGSPEGILVWVGVERTPIGVDGSGVDGVIFDVSDGREDGTELRPGCCEKDADGLKLGDGRALGSKDGVPEGTSLWVQVMEFGF